MGHRARLETATVSHPHRSRQDRARKPCFSHARGRSRFGCEQCCVEDREDRQEHAESVRRRNPERQNNRRTERDAARQWAGPCRKKYSETDRSRARAGVSTRNPARDRPRLVRNSKRRQLCRRYQNSSKMFRREKSETAFYQCRFRPGRRCAAFFARGTDDQRLRSSLHPAYDQSDF